MEIIKQKRLMLKLTQKQISDELGVAQRSYSRYENGEHYPSYGMLIRMSELLDIPIESLVRAYARIER